MGSMVRRWIWIVRLQVAGVRPEIVERGLHHRVHLYEGQHGEMFIKAAPRLSNKKDVE
jgi:hypothetical protein